MQVFQDINYSDIVVPPNHSPAKNHPSANTILNQDTPNSMQHTGTTADEPISEEKVVLSLQKQNQEDEKPTTAPTTEYQTLDDSKTVDIELAPYSQVESNFETINHSMTAEQLQCHADRI